MLSKLKWSHPKATGFVLSNIDFALRRLIHSLNVVQVVDWSHRRRRTGPKWSLLPKERHAVVKTYVQRVLVEVLR